MIDADAFADFLKNTIKKQKYDALKVNGDTLTVGDVLESVIAELDGTSLDGFKNNPTIEPQRWIPVSERLPERGKDVLVTRDYDGRADHIKSCRYVEVASCYGEDDDVSWNSYSDEYKMTPKNHRAVAWMPLPEPYAERRTDE